MEIQRRFYAEGILLPSIVCEAVFCCCGIPVFCGRCFSSLSLDQFTLALGSVARRKRIKVRSDLNFCRQVH